MPEQSDAWPNLIGHIILLKQQITDMDPRATVTYRLPRTAAEPDTVRLTEMRLGEELDSSYREFLGYADGWPGFEVSLQVFGTSELGEGNLWQTAEQYLDIFCSTAGSTYSRQDLFPVAVASEDKDVIAVCRAGSVHEGKVIWVAGELIDTFPSFYDYVASIAAYHQEDLDELTAGETRAARTFQEGTGKPRSVPPSEPSQNPFG